MIRSTDYLPPRFRKTARATWYLKLSLFCVCVFYWLSHCHTQMTRHNIQATRRNDVKKTVNRFIAILMGFRYRSIWGFFVVIIHMNRQHTVSTVTFSLIISKNGLDMFATLLIYRCRSSCHIMILVESINGNNHCATPCDDKLTKSAHFLHIEYMYTFVSPCFSAWILYENL